MILVIDNYDSFVYNLARYVSELGLTYQVYRNNAIDIQQIEFLNPSHIILSPGPCTPNEAGICLEIVTQLGATIPLLGVCLGHQAIGQAYGGKVIRALAPKHGKSSLIQHHQTGLFQGLTNPLKVARYHSLVVDTNHLPSCLEITASSQEGEIMAIQHRHYPVFGVQFHPESVLTAQGHVLLQNFLKYKHHENS